MRRLLLLAVLVLTPLTITGCLINEYPSDPNLRMKVLLNQSEDERQITNEWLRFWMVDQPSHMTFERVDGEIGP
jgi:Mg-chelatase subunit ChlI